MSRPAFPSPTLRLLACALVCLLPACPEVPPDAVHDAPASEPAVAPAPALFVEWPSALAPMVCGRPECPTILEVNGGGLALFDADGDGDQDLLLVIPGAYPAHLAATGGTNRLYRNDGGRFTDVTAGSGVDVAGYCNGVAVGDVDADGRRDLYITRLGSNVLLRNLGECRFAEVPDAAGAAAGGWSTSALFVDIDRDGDLDLYVTRYLAFDPDAPPLDGQHGRTCKWLGMSVMCGPQGLPAQSDLFFVNDGGRFREATAERGFAATPSYGLGVIDGDWNDDGLPDVYVANDSMPNFLFLGQADGTVREAGVLSGAALSGRGREQASMGLASGDADGDGDEDLMVTNFSLEPDAFYVNLGQGRFSDRADPAGIGAPSRALLGWGTAFLDADLDGDLDLVTSNGHVYPQADAPDSGTAYAQPALLWRNDGHGRFATVRWPGDAPAVGRALACGDLDDDGVLDLVITRLSGPPVIYRGTAAGASSVRVSVHGRPGNPDGCGTELSLVDAQGSRRWRVRSSGGFQSACDPRAVFAWRGPATLHVVFPDGRTETRELSAPGPVQIAEPAP